MADDSYGERNAAPVPGAIGTLRMSTIIPAIEEARRQRPPIVPSLGLPQASRTPQEMMIERVMEEMERSIEYSERHDVSQKCKAYKLLQDLKTFTDKKATYVMAKT